MGSVLVVKVPDGMLRILDALIEKGYFANRSDAVRALLYEGLKALLDAGVIQVDDEGVRVI